MYEGNHEVRVCTWERSQPAISELGHVGQGRTCAVRSEKADNFAV